MIKKVFVFCLLQALVHSVFCQSVKTRWIDSVFQTLNVSEKVGQLFMVPVENNSDAASIEEVKQLLQNFEMGGILFRQNKVLPPPTLISSYHTLSDVPLFFGWNGDASLLPDSTLNFPAPFLIGATRNDTLVYAHGLQLGNYLRSAGINFYFTTVNATTPKIGTNIIQPDLFSEDLLTSSWKAVALMQGLQREGVVVCARHFTVRGVNVTELKRDFHVDVTVDSVRALAYAGLINNGLKSIQVAPNDLPVFSGNIAATKKQYTPAALTTLFTPSWLKSNLNFEGLSVVTASRIRAKEDEGETELLAFKHGADIIITKDVVLPIKKIKRLVRKDNRYMEQLDNSVRKILAAKFDAELWHRAHLEPAPLSYSDKSQLRVVNQKIHENAITILRNEDKLLPIEILDNRKFAYLSTDHSEKSDKLYGYLSRYVGMSNNLMDEKSNDKDLLKALRSFQTIVVGIFPETSEKMLQRLDNLFDQLPHNPDVVICDFGNESFLKSANRYPVVVTGYRDHDIMIRSVPQIVFGALPAGGTLPFSIASEMKAGTGLSTEALGRLTYSVPEDAKMDGRLLTRIDSIAKEAIDTRGTPGCQVFVARNGKVIYDKSFGHLTYDKKDPVTANTIYDLASVTKVTATLQTAMFMYEHGLIDLHKKVSVYLPELKKTNKKDITVIDMLTHQSGLVPFIPMYNVTVKDTVFLPLYYDRTQSEKYPLQVADRLYASPVLRDSVWSWVLRSKMNDKPVRTPYSYKYSDLGFMILQRMAERLLNQPMDDFLNQNLYEPLGATTLGFNPLTRFNKQIIAPTEDDKIYRRTHVAGTVHDERAAMLGGVAGHAGLFGTATDLGKLGQMLLQNGFYGGYQYFKPETLKLFTARKFRTSRRGIGWDKPLQSEPNGPTSMYASPLTFGHTGFTGTCIWIDPEFDLVYIFLSNRVYPDRSSKLINANIRSRIQDIIYKSIFAYEEREEPVPVVAQGLTIKAQENRPLE